MDIKEVQEIIKKECYINGRLNPNLYRRSWWDKKYIENVYNFVMDYTDFLEGKITWRQRVWHIMHEMPNLPQCKNKNCNKEMKWNHDDYRKYCSLKCSNSDEAFLRKREQTMIDKYGAPTTLESKELKERVRQTNLERYGVENQGQREEIKEKIRQTNLEKYGVEYTMQSEELREKARQTTLKKYGVEHVLQAPEVINKRKETNLEKYGVENVMQADEIKEKRKAAREKNKNSGSDLFDW